MRDVRADVNIGEPGFCRVFAADMNPIERVIASIIPYFRSGIGMASAASIMRERDVRGFRVAQLLANRLAQGIDRARQNNIHVVFDQNIGRQRICNAAVNQMPPVQQIRLEPCGTRPAWRATPARARHAAARLPAHC